MEDFEIPDDPGAPPPGVLTYAPWDDPSPREEPFPWDEPSLRDEPLADYPDPATLTPYVRRQQVFGVLLADTEVEDGRVAAAMAARARSIDELRRLSVAHAAEEAAEDAAKPPELRAGRGHESGWSIQNRAKTELTTEIAAALNLSKNAARHLIEESQTLVAHLPITLDALATGTVRYEHAALIASTAWGLPDEARAPFEEELVPWAKVLIFAAFKAKVVAAREKFDTTSMEERHEKAAASRTVTKELGENGMGYLTLYDSNEVVAGIFNRVTDLSFTKAKGDPRSLNQRRADVTAEILLKGDLCASVDAAAAAGAAAGMAAGTAANDGDAADQFGIGADGKRLGHGITAQVHVEIPLLTLLGKDDTPATLEGIVPIDPATARELVADAPGLYRLLTDPVTGSIVAFDDRFRFLPKSLRRAVRLVDGHCTSPWCDASERESDGHHPDEWADSHDTSLDNSALVCPPDHRIIHNTRWTMIKLKNGDKKWISPCGRVRLVPPQRRLSPRFVQAVTDQPPKPKRTPDGWHDGGEPEVMPF